VVSTIVKVRLAETAALLHASVAVQCAVITRVAPQPGTLLSSTYTGVTAPLQISLALALAFQVASAVVLPVPSHSTLSLAGGVRLGSVVRTIVKVRLAETAALLHASVAVQCAVITRVAPQPGTLLSSTYTGVTAPLQISLALALAFQVASAVVLPVPSHSTLSLAGGVRLGSVVSTIVKIRLAETAALLHASVAVQCAVITRVAPQPGTLLSSTYTGVTAPLQISLALAPAFQVASAVVLPVPSHSTLSLAGGVRLGSVVSTIVKVRLAETAASFLASVAVQCAVITRVAPQPGTLLSSTYTGVTAPLQISLALAPAFQVASAVVLP